MKVFAECVVEWTSTSQAKQMQRKVERIAGVLNDVWPFDHAAISGAIDWCWCYHEV